MTEPTLLVAKLCREFKIDYHKVMTHYDVEAKIDLTDAIKWCRVDTGWADDSAQLF